MSITGQAAEPESIGAQLAAPLDDPAPPVPDDPASVAMATVHALDDCGRHLAHASGHLDAAQDATGDLRDHHLGHVTRHLGGAHTSAHQLVDNLRAHYPGEAKALDDLTATIGLAVAVSDQAKESTTGHLAQTVCNHLGHVIEHVQAMTDDPDPEVWAFNGEHARTHLDGAVEHVGKLTRHLTDNYPREAAHLAGLDAVAAGADGGDGIAAQMAGPVTVSGQLAGPAKTG